MPAKRNVSAAVLKDRARKRDLRRAQNDLYYVAYKLGYGWSPPEQQGLTREFHGPMCERMDSLRDHPRVGTFCQRKGLKSTVFSICLAVQEILRDPDITIMVNHAVEEEAEAILQEVGEHFRSNEWLRSLDPVGKYPVGYFIPEKVGKPYRIMPLASNRKFLKSGSFTVRRAGHKPTTKRQPTMRAKGAGAEITGAHVDLILLDDIIGLKTLEESTGMSRIRSWWKRTALNVLNTMGRVRLVGTRWDEYDVYSDFFASGDWDILVRHARETDGKMDYKGDPTHYGPLVTLKSREKFTADEAYREHVAREMEKGLAAARVREEAALKEMGQADYAAQRMNDPSPQSEKPWKESCEQFIPRTEAQGPGVFFIFSDPAPAKVGSFDGVGEKKRGDGTKDDWAIAVFKCVRRGQLNLAVLIDGSFSKEWTPDAGEDEICRYAQRYPGAWVYNESYGGLQADREHSLRKSARRNGVRLKILPFKGAYQSKAKNLRIAKLAEKAENGEFLICDSVPKDFVEEFLGQARLFRPLPLGRNNLRHDDVLDVCSFVTLSCVEQHAPREDLSVVSSEFSPFKPMPGNESMGRQFGRRIRA